MKKKRIISLGIVLMLLVGMMTACGNSKKETSKSESSKEKITKITVGSGFTYYPFSYLDGSEKSGFEVDVWNEIGKRTDTEIEFKQAAFSGLFGLLDKGDIDVIANQVSKNEERSEKYYFSVPYCYSPLKLVVPKGNPDNINTLDDLVGKTVVGSVNGTELKIFQDKFPNNEANIITSQGDNFSYIVSEKADATIQDAASTAITIKDQQLPLEIVGEALDLEIDCYPFAKTNRGETLKEMVDKVLTEMHEDGTLTKLSEKWFDYDLSVDQ